MASTWCTFLLDPSRRISSYHLLDIVNASRKIIQEVHSAAALLLMTSLCSSLKDYLTSKSQLPPRVFWVMTPSLQSFTKMHNRWWRFHVFGHDSIIFRIPCFTPFILLCSTTWPIVLLHHYTAKKNIFFSFFLLSYIHGAAYKGQTVSYTHLTLPTILLV